MPRHPLRTLVRLLGFLAIVVMALIDVGVRRVVSEADAASAGRGWDVRRRAAWLHRWTARALRFMGIRLDVQGAPPAAGVLVSNHLGYLDVFVYSAIAPTVFVSNADVAGWPLAGALAKLAGTIFIDRKRRADVVKVGAAMVPVIDAGQPLALFLEGTSTGGDQVLRFHSSLLEPAVRGRWPLTPAFISYHAPGISTSRELCYWGDAVFFPHFINLLGLPGAEARVRFGATFVADGDRRALAERLHAEVCALRVDPSMPPSPRSPGSAR
jgi:lyso-ornithine lipid O-acyltransferase